MPKFHDKTNGRFFDVPDDQMDQFGAAVLQNKWDVEPAETYVTRDRQTFNVAKSAEKKWLQNRADTGLSFGSWDGEDWVTQVDKKDVKSDGSDLGVYLKKDLEAWNEFSKIKAEKAARREQVIPNIIQGVGDTFAPIIQGVEDAFAPKDFVGTPQNNIYGPSLFGQGGSGYTPSGIPTSSDQLPLNQIEESDPNMDSTTNLAERIAGANITGIAKGLAQMGQTGGGVTSAVGRFSEHVINNATAKLNNIVQTMAPKFFEDRVKKNRAKKAKEHGPTGAITPDKGGVSRFIQNVGETARDFHAETLSELERDFPTGDITKNPELMIDPVFLTQSIAQMVTVIGGSMALGGGSLAGAAIAGSTMEAEPFFRELEEKGVPVDVAFGKAVAFGTLVAKLNHIGLDKIFNGKGTSALRRRLSAALAEGSTEFAESPVAAIIEAAGEEGLTPTEFGGRMFQAVRDGINEGYPALLTGGLLSQKGGNSPSNLEKKVRSERDIDRGLRQKALEEQKANEEQAKSTDAPNFARNPDGSITIDFGDSESGQSNAETDTTSESTIVSDPEEARRLRDEEEAARVPDSELSPLSPHGAKLKPEAQADVERNKKKGYGEIAVDEESGAVYQEATVKLKNGKEKVVRRYVTTGGAVNLQIGDTVDEGHNIDRTAVESTDNLRNDDTDVWVVHSILDPATDTSGMDSKIRTVQRRATDEELANLEKGKAKAAAMRAELAEKDVSGITPEAKKLLVRADNGKTPDKITTALRITAKRNGVSIAAGDRPADVIKKLRDKESAYQKSLSEKSSEAEVKATSDPTINQEAQDLLENVEKGGVPFVVTTNLKKIAEDNDVAVGPDTTPNEIIDALKAKQESAPVTPKVTEPKPYSKDNIKEAMDLTDEETEAVDVIVQSLGIADEIEVGRGGVAGENALEQRGQTQKLSKADQKSVDASGKTAISRSKTSTLVRGLDKSNVSGRVLHQGSGRSNNPDRNALETISDDVVHYDPTHSPDSVESMGMRDFDTVVTPFVVNTLKPTLRSEVYKEAAKSLAPEGKVIISARSDVDKSADASEKKGKPWKRFKDGYITNSGTFQRNYTEKSLVKEAKKYFDNVEVMLDKNGKKFPEPTVVASSPKAATLRGKFTKDQKIFRKRKRNIVETKAQRKFSGRADTIPTSRISSAKKESGAKDFDLFDVEPSEQLVSWQMESIRHDRNNPGYAGVPKEVFDAKSPEKAKEIYVEWLKNNLIKLHNSVPKKIRVRAKLWYEGSRKIAEEFSETYGTSVRQAAGVLAALSPQKNWFYNVTQARQVIAIWKTKEEFGTSPELMEQTIEEIIEVAKAPAEAKKGKSEARKKALDAEAKQERREAFEPVRGKTVGELYAIYEKTGLEDDLISVGWAVRARAQAQFGREANAFTPEGQDLGPYTNEKGKVLKNTWGSISEITKSINILADDSLDTISENLGNEHKVRNFYNNIINPNDARGYVTIDTHAVAAAHILPFGASARPVKHNFGTKAIGNMAAEGFNGSYHMYQDAYDQAARELGLLPRELQSIVWEAIRGIYPQNLKNEAYLQEKASVWEQYNENEARERLAGQSIRDPFWFNPVYAGGVKADEGVLRGAQDAGGSPVDRGGSARGSRGLEQRSNATGSALGTMEVLDSGKALIRGFKGSNISTALHEIAHVVRNTLLNRSVDQSSRKGITNEDISVAEEWAGAKDGKWTVEAEEKFARGMERYLRDGKSPNAKLNDVFSKIQAWLIEIYEKVKGSEIDIDISPEMKTVFDKLLTRSDAKPDAKSDVKSEENNADQEKTIKLTHAETSILLEAMGKKRGAKISKENQEAFLQAKKEGTDVKALEIATKVLDNPRALLDFEHIGLVLKAGMVKNEITELIKKIDSEIDAGRDVTELTAEKDSNENILDILIRASDLSGTEVGRSLQIRKIRISLATFTLENTKRRMKASKGKALDKKEEKEIEKLVNQVNDLQKQIDKYEDDLLNVGSKSEAEQELVTARKSRAKRSESATEKKRSEIKEELRKLNIRVNDVTNIPIITIQMAKLVQELAFTYVDQGIHKLDDVKSKIQNDIPDISNKGVYDSIGGRIQRMEKRAEAETKKIKTELVKQSKLKGQIEDGYNKIFDPKRKSIPTSSEVKNLKNILGRLKESYEKTEFDPEVYDSKLDEINAINSQIDGHYRDLKPRNKQKETVLINLAKKELSRVTSKMSKIDELADLAEQIRTGKIKIPAETENSKSPELDKLNAEIKFAKENIARITSGKAMSGKTDAAVIEDIQRSLTEVKDQIDKGYRKLPNTKKHRAEKVEETRQSLKELIDLRKTKDRISDLEKRIREKDFAVSEKQSINIKSQQLAEARIKMLDLQRKLRSLEYSLKKKTWLEKLGNVASFPRSMLATMDMSYALRQAIVPSAAHPILATKSFSKAFVAFWSKKKSDAAEIDLKNHPRRHLFDKYGIYFSSMDRGLSLREEAFTSNMAEKLWGFGHVVMASERNMMTGLNLFRAALMDDFLLKNPNLDGDVLGKKTKDLSKEIEALESSKNDSPKALKEYKKKIKDLTVLQRNEQSKFAYARYVNIATGRGDLGNLGASAETLSLLFFAPRFLVSRLQLPFVVGADFIKYPELRAEIGKQMAFHLVVGHAMLRLASLAGASVSFDPDDTDFGKIVIGNIHIDIWGGSQQPMRQMLLYKKGVQQGFKKDRSDWSPADWERFIRYKISPFASIVYEFGSGKNVIGQTLEDYKVKTPYGDIGIPWQAISVTSKFVPIIVQSGIEAYKEGEDPKIVISLLLGESLGLSISVYKK